ncbi:MAG: glycosyltransferase family 4 protein [Deltaproteobacteria bacterium]|nr:glycosyltransferase family 4 protein [Deltaproteobacteria bacterium]
MLTFGAFPGQFWIKWASFALKMNVSKPSSILFIDQYSSMGGGQVVLLELIATSLDSALSVSLLCPLGGNLEAEILKRFGKRIELINLWQPPLTVGKKNWRDFFLMIAYSIYFFKFYNLIKRHRKIFVNGGRLFFPVALISIFLKRYFFYFVHLDHSKIEKKIIQWILKLKNTSAVFTTSEFVFDRLFNFLPNLFKQKSKLKILQSCLSRRFSKAVFKDKFLKEIEPSRVVVIGRVSPEKGQDIIFRIASHLENVEFHIVGSFDFAKPDFFNNLKQNRAANIFFHEHTTNIQDFVDSNEIQYSLVPSVWEEPFGLVAIESMSMSLITIVRASGGLLEISNKTGALTFKSDEDLITLMNQLFKKSKKDLISLSRQQFENVTSIYSPENFERNFQTMVLDI